MFSTSHSRPIRVLVVDDSAVVRRVVSETLNAQSDIEVVGVANDPYAARDQLKVLKPDVITLDVEMPRMDGLTFLRLLMQHHPLPVIVMSSLTSKGSQIAMDALRLGAVEVLCKPHGSYSVGNLDTELVHSVRAAAAARVRRNPGATPATKPPPPTPGLGRADPSPPENPRRVILLAASTGGTEALREVLVQLPGNLPPIAIVQHIPAAFSRAFAERLDSQCVLKVREAGHDELCQPGEAIIAPGNFHLLLQRTPRGYRTQLNDGPQVWHQRPAADVLFRSIRAPDRPFVIGGVFTGMGKDGAAGLKDLRDGGAMTFAQDEASCVVYGMPKEAWDNGGAEQQVSLHQAPRLLMKLAATPVRPLDHALSR